ncbi:glycerate kinase [Clostridium sp. SM-530-WT-3G]|uniref:glycerate kinase n=1 Tax=Clostridium sp. SM-530-WT-3G TaxID=2725303 RepID=UPI00145E1482|nr:glycerate kinase [Clostridium sp. SM-530-WT-3G]NME84002.1 glycerate kinase [Clostridium sp. SM-530-WT-3G]
MKFVLAPDSFKESMTSKEACDAMERAIKKVIKDAECVKVPMADGGEGTTTSLVDGSNGEIFTTEVTGPIGDKVEAIYGIMGDKETGIIEMAMASGIQLVKREERNPLIATTYGTGELIKALLDKGVKRILLGIGGSATNDGGAGMVQALGGRLLDKDGNEVKFGGGHLHEIEKIDLSNLDIRLKDVKIEVACDVTNPFIGENGASRIFGPQKGADEEMVQLLDDNLAHFAEVIKRELGRDIVNVPGAGAAGGLGGALLAFLNAELKRGIEMVIQHTNLREKVEGADFVFTGEGSIDGQTLFGKTPIGVAKTAKEAGAKVIAFAGRVADDADTLYDGGIDSIFCILNELTSLDNALENGAHNLEKTVENVVRILALK